MFFMFIKIAEVSVYCFIILFLLSIFSSPRLFYGKVEPKSQE